MRFDSFTIGKERIYFFFGKKEKEGHSVTTKLQRRHIPGCHIDSCDTGSNRDEAKD